MPGSGVGLAPGLLLANAGIIGLETSVTLVGFTFTRKCSTELMLVPVLAGNVPSFAGEIHDVKGTPDSGGKTVD